MREEYASVRDDATLDEAFRALRDIRVKQPDANFVLVFSEKNEFIGILTMWDLIQCMGPRLLKEPVLADREVDWDQAFGQACRHCSQVNISDVEAVVPVLKPNDPVLRALEVFLSYRRSRAVVEEGGKILGVVTVADLFREIARSLP
jgi:CBS domain-containing protein